MISHRRQLGSVVLDVAVPGDGDPPGSGHHRDPVEVPCVRRRDGAHRTDALVDQPARIARIGDIGADGRDQLAQPEDVSVEVEPDRCGLHAARAEIS